MPQNSSELFKVTCDLSIAPNKPLSDIRLMGGLPISSLVKRVDMGSELPVYVDKLEAHKYVKLNIVLLTEFFGTTWTDLQIRECAKNIYELTYFFTPYDWKAFISRVESGIYGKIWGNAAKDFSPGHLLECVNEYRNEWIAVSEQMAQSAHENVKQAELNGTLEDKNLAFIKATKLRVDKIEHEPAVTGERLWNPEKFETKNKAK